MQVPNIMSNHIVPNIMSNHDACFNDPASQARTNAKPRPMRSTIQARRAQQLETVKRQNLARQCNASETTHDSAPSADYSLVIFLPAAPPSCFFTHQIPAFVFASESAGARRARQLETIRNIHTPDDRGLTPLSPNGPEGAHDAVRVSSHHRLFRVLFGVLNRLLTPHILTTAPK